MAKMRTMTHNSRTNASGRVHGTKHNDRNFDVGKADNIDAAKVKDNEYRNCYGDSSMTFDEVELKFYTENFSHQLEKTNAKYIENRHPERCKTMDEWKKLRQYCPEETTRQIGKMESHESREKLVECYNDYYKQIQQWNRDHGKPFTVLDRAVHVDEAVPHIQERRVWHYKGDDGKWYIGQEKALQMAGVELPNPDKPESRYNNRKMTFDKMSRELWLDICKEHGLDLEREALPNGKHNRDKEDMIREKYEEAIKETERLQAENSNLKKALEETKSMHKEWQDDLTELMAEYTELDEKVEGRSADYRQLDEEASDLEERVNTLANVLERREEAAEELTELEEQVEAARKELTDWRNMNLTIDSVAALLMQAEPKRFRKDIAEIPYNVLNDTVDSFKKLLADNSLYRDQFTRQEYELRQLREDKDRLIRDRLRDQDKARAYDKLIGYVRSIGKEAEAMSYQVMNPIREDQRSR